MDGRRENGGGEEEGRWVVGGGQRVKEGSWVTEFREKSKWWSFDDRRHGVRVSE